MIFSPSLRQILPFFTFNYEQAYKSEPLLLSVSYGSNQACTAPALVFIDHIMQ